MASQVRTLIDQVKAGSLEINEAATQMKDIVLGGAVARPEPGTPEHKDFVNQRLADKDDEGYEDSLQEVTAAWIGKDLSDSQYYIIREAITEGLSVEESEEEEDDDAE